MHDDEHVRRPRIDVGAEARPIPEDIDRGILQLLLDEVGVRQPFRAPGRGDGHRLPRATDPATERGRAGVQLVGRGGGELADGARARAARCAA